MKRAAFGVALLGLGWASAGCVVGASPTTGQEASVRVDVAALNLAGVGDVVWDLEVVNSASQTVWRRRVTSTTHGDSAGSASYVGPCDADASPNTVRVWVVGVYAGDITAADAGAFASGADTGVGAVIGAGLPFQNPTETAPLTRQVACAANADAAVSFDVALMRPAQQGFFDVAVSFNDVFCSAKLDCCTPGLDDVCATDGTEDIALLFDADGDRARTIVLGLACTAGTASDVDTALYMTPLELDCDVSSGAGTFLADVTLDPDPDAPGNLCTAGANGMSTCAAISEADGVDADSYLFQMAVYRGEEALTNGGAGAANKVYWNVALGVNANISACTLRVRATADDAADPDDGVDGGAIAAGVVYPYVQWDADLDSCAAEELTFGDDAAMVQARYTGVGATSDTTFPFSFAPTVPIVEPDPEPQYVFHYTGADQLFVVPDGVTSIDVKLWGAGGGGGGTSFDGGRPSVGGGGGFASGTLTVTPGETLTLIVGAGGLFTSVSSVYGGGGGAGSYGGDLVGTGGGRSAVRRGGTELVTAGAGGGGGGEDSPRDGGAGGGLVGADATGGGPSGSPACGGGGGTQTSGGPRAICTHNVSQDGSFLQGGTSPYCGGGGGGGWYGGGSGDHQTGAITCGGGGGGSGHLDASVVGGVLVGGSGQAAAMTSDPDYEAGVAVGGENHAAGGPGLVVILY